MGRLEYMQGGPLGIALLRADIHSIHPVMPGDAVCSLYAKCHGTFSIKTDPVTGVRNGTFTGDGDAFRFTDVIHPSCPVFARRIECFDTVSFGISTPPHVRRSLFEKGDGYSLLLSSHTGDICITLRGKALFTPDGCIRLGTGKSELVICSLTGDIAAGFPGVPPTFDEIYESALKDPDMRINTPELRDIVNRTCYGGVLHDFSDCTYHTEEQYEAIGKLCQTGLYIRAKNIINFMYRVYENLGYLPAVYGEKPQIDPFPPIRNAYLAIALKDYYEASKDVRFVRRILPDIAVAMTAILDLIKGGHLPHLGDEGVRGKDLFLPSAKSEELFSTAAKAVLQMSRELKIRICCASALRSALDAMGKTSDVHPRPMRSLRTTCEECQKEGVCYLGKGGLYLCPECYIK